MRDALAEVSQFVFQRLDARRELAHVGHRLVAGLGQLEEHSLDQDGEDDDGPAPVTDEGVDPLEDPEDRLGDDR